MVTCTGPFFHNEPFTCKVTCNGSAVNADWSLLSSSSSGSVCAPTSASETSCTLVSDATIKAENPGLCTNGSVAITLEYSDAKFFCNPLKVRAGTNTSANPGENFVCTAS